LDADHLTPALAGTLPAEVQWRGSKSNLGPNFQHGLLAYERERLEELILKDSTAIENYGLHQAERETMHLRFGKHYRWAYGSSGQA
jgi:hypothetical protein